jgi:hypothetical protein
MAVDLILEQQTMFDPKLRERVKASLVTFPEAAALDSNQFDAAVDMIIKQSNPETASPAAPGMCRSSDEEIGAFFYHKTEIPAVDDLVPSGSSLRAGLKSGGSNWRRKFSRKKGSLAMTSMFYWQRSVLICSPRATSMFQSCTFRTRQMCKLLGWERLLLAFSGAEDFLRSGRRAR